jgi:hypothetical protein
MFVVAAAVAVLVFVGGGNSVGPARYVSLVLRGRCSLQMRVPVSLQLTRVHGYPALLTVSGDGLPRRVIGDGFPTAVLGSCVPGETVSRIVAVESEPGSAEKLSNGAYVADLTRDGDDGVMYVVPLAGGAIGFTQTGDSVNAALVYMIEHTRGRILPCAGAAAGCPVKSTSPPNVVALKPPSGLSDSQRATFVAGEAIAGETGCEGCHVIGDSGNNGPGPPLTHIGVMLRPAAIDAALRHPDAPMPSFSGLAETSPKKFRELVLFLAMLK